MKPTANFPLVFVLFIILLKTSVCSQSAAAADLRIIGTNLFDFSSAGPSFTLGGPSMRIVKIYPQSVQIEINSSEVEFVPEIQRPTPGDPSDLLRALGQFRATPNSDGTPVHLSAGAAWIMGIPGHEEQVMKTTTIYLLNYPKSNGYTLEECHAVPTSIRGFWDCGIPFSGNPYEFKYVYRVLSDRIKRERLYSPEEIHEADMKLFAYQLQQASNNVAADQFEVGKRYLAGKGVETNDALAFHWINLAASNSFPEAVEFQKFMPHPPQNN
jgi:hypothetical protein